MHITHSLLGPLPLLLAAVAFASGPAVRPHLAADAGASGVSAHAQKRADAVASAGLIPGATVSQDTIAGLPATVVHLPSRAPLRPEEVRRIEQAGYVAVVKDAGTFYCRRTTADGRPVNDCFKFDTHGQASEGAKDSRKGSQNKSAPPPHGVGPVELS